MTRRWTLRHEFLERSGRIRVQLQASVTATRNGSTPWETNSQSVIVELYPTLNLEVRLPTDQPLPWHAHRVPGDGHGSLGDVGVTVLNVDTGANVAGLEEVLSFDGSQPSLGGSWTMRARELERVGTHHLRLVARYGDLEVKSDPIAFVVTHTIDEVTSLVRYADGRLGSRPCPIRV